MRRFLNIVTAVMVINLSLAMAPRSEAGRKGGEGSAELKIPGQGFKNLTMAFWGGSKATVWVSEVNNPNGEVMIKVTPLDSANGGEIQGTRVQKTDDKPARAEVTFEPKQTGLYRIEIWYPDDGANNIDQSLMRLVKCAWD